MKKKKHWVKSEKNFHWETNFTTYKRHKLQQEPHNSNKEASNKTDK